MTFELWAIVWRAIHGLIMVNICANLSEKSPTKLQSISPDKHTHKHWNAIVATMLSSAQAVSTKNETYY